MTDFVNPTPTPDVSANPTPGPDQTGSTVPPSGQVNGQSTPAEEMFGNVDPKTLPPQLKSVYDNMLRGFKEKTTKLSETVKSEVTKATESLKQKAEFYDRIAAEEEFVKQWNEHVQKRNTAQTPQQPTDPTQKELEAIKERQAALEMKAAVAENLDAINAFRGAKNEKGDVLHPDWDDLSEIMVATTKAGKELSLLELSVLTAPGETVQERMEAGYKKAKASFDAIFERGKKAGMGRVQDKARNGSLVPSGTVRPSGTAPHRPKNAMEALQFARQGLVPSKD